MIIISLVKCHPFFFSLVLKIKNRFRDATSHRGGISFALDVLFLDFKNHSFCLPPFFVFRIAFLK